MASRSPRAMILLAVLVVVTMSALVGSTMLYRVDAVQASVMSTTDQGRLRALAWSGVLGAMTELELQRDVLRDGGRPTLRASTDLWTREGRRGTFRLVPLDDAGQELAQTELSRLDANKADVSLLSKLPGWSEPVAAGVVSARTSRPFESDADVARVPEIRDLILAEPEIVRSASPGLSRRKEPIEADPLSHITAFSFVPNTQAAAWTEDESARDQPRVHVDSGWSDEVQQSLRARLTPESMPIAESILKGGTLKDASALVGALRANKAPTERWAELLDVLTASDDEFLRGCVDLSHAPAAVLACVPGIDAAAAERIVQTRDRLEADAKQTIVWPLTEGILTPEQFQSAAVWLATRSLVWRVRVEATISPAEREDAEDAGGAETHAPRMVWDAVIDLTGATPRVAYLRDVTFAAEAKIRARAALARIEAAEEAAAPDLPEADPASDSSAQGESASRGDPRPSRPDAEAKPRPARNDQREKDPQADESPPPKRAPEAQDRRIGRWRDGK